MNNMQRISAIDFLFCFFFRNNGNFYIMVYIIARKNLFHPYKIGWAPYGDRLIYYNADRAPYDVIIYSRRPAPVRYVTTQEKTIKSRTVPGQLLYSPASVLFVTIALITHYTKLTF